MRLTMSMLLLIPCLSTVAVSADDLPGIFDEVIYDFSEDMYYPGTPQILADLGVGPATLIELRWEDVVIETYNNVGIPNWANEAWMGVRVVDANGLPFDQMVQPFPGIFEDGLVGPTNGSMDLSLLDLFSTGEGLIEVLVASGWDDGSGMAAGSFVSGSLIVRYQQLVPAPASIALLCMAGCLTRRRRRR